MKRIGEYKEASHREALAYHLALPLEKRLQRSWEFYELFWGTPQEFPCEDGAISFYARAHQLGLYSDDA